MFDLASVCRLLRRAGRRSRHVGGASASGDSSPLSFSARRVWISVVCVTGGQAQAIGLGHAGQWFHLQAHEIGCVGNRITVAAAARLPWAADCSKLVFIKELRLASPASAARGRVRNPRPVVSSYSERIELAFSGRTWRPGSAAEVLASLTNLLPAERSAKAIARPPPAAGWQPWP